MPPQLLNDFQGYTLSAPSTGIDLVAPIDNMDPTSARELVNMFPTGRNAILRGGYSELVDIGNDEIEMLSSLPLASGSSKLVAAMGAKLSEVSTGTESVITGSTTPTSASFNSDVFAHRLFMANGVDAVQVYDGTSVVDSTFSGVTLENLINVSSYKERIYFIERDSLNVWYGNTQAVGSSALTLLPLQYAMKRGGKLLFAGSWSNQLAATSADLFFACSSEGEIVFFNGSSPADTSTPWGLVARFVIGRPLGHRAFIRVNNDVWILTEQGIVPISSLFSVSPEAALDTIGKKINPLIARYAKLVGPSHRWHGVHWPNGRRVYVVIPTSNTAVFLAVYGLDAQGWCTYELNSAKAACNVAVADGAPFFASSDGVVYEAEKGYNDDGAAINIRGRLPFSFFGSRGNYKEFKDIRPLMYARRGQTLQIGIETNFQEVRNLDTLTSAPGDFTPWGSPWGSPWSSGMAYIFERFSVRGQGHSGAIRFRASVKDAPLELYGFEIRFRLGGQV